jgi:hypothetical protein
MTTMATDILKSLRRNAARKSELDADKALLTRAADEIESLRAQVELWRSLHASERHRDDAWVPS